MQIEWPEKIEMDFYGESTQPYNQTCVNVGWNSAIDACREAFDKAQGISMEEFQDLVHKWETDVFPITEFYSKVSPALGRWKDDIFNIIRNEDWFCKSRIPTHEDIYKTADKISATKTDKRRGQETITHNDLRADEIAAIFEAHAESFGYTKTDAKGPTDSQILSAMDSFPCHENPNGKIYYEINKGDFLKAIRKLIEEGK